MLVWRKHRGPRVWTGCHEAQTGAKAEGRGRRPSGQNGPAGTPAHPGGRVRSRPEPHGEESKQNLMPPGSPRGAGQCGEGVCSGRRRWRAPARGGGAPAGEEPSPRQGACSQGSLGPSQEMKRWGLGPRTGRKPGRLGDAEDAAGYVERPDALVSQTCLQHSSSRSQGYGATKELHAGGDAVPHRHRLLGPEGRWSLLELGKRHFSLRMGHS